MARADSKTSRQIKRTIEGQIEPHPTWLLGQPVDTSQVRDVPLRLLAHLGDAVFHLYEREREVVRTSSASQMHKRARVKATQQAELLQLLLPSLTEEEQDLVRRARNLKASGFRKVDQSSYRQATAFEALLGFLYLTDIVRLKQILNMTIDLVQEPQGGEN